MVVENTGSYYTNAWLQEVERDIQKEAEQLRQSSKNISDEEIMKQAKMNAFKKQEEGTTRSWNKYFLGFTAGLLTAVIFGVLYNYKLVDVIQKVQLSDLNATGEGIVTSAITAAEQTPAAVTDTTQADKVLQETTEGLVDRLGQDVRRLQLVARFHKHLYNAFNLF